ANVNLRDGAGKTPLHFAGIHFQPAAAQFLIDHGADVSIADGHGNTPLSDAVYYAKSDQGEVILALLAAGADKHQKNKHGSSPYLLANLIATTNVRQFLVGE
ncbi:MAG TPA: ankyrin repeat domain-containing protein, partial [Fimbriimonadaceae bacterium]|nr:ankyrin repeat domain-containing protein [Fimbriimonadaceae bacterium]